MPFIFAEKSSKIPLELFCKKGLLVVIRDALSWGGKHDQDCAGRGWSSIHPSYGNGALRRRRLSSLTANGVALVESLRRQREPAADRLIERIMEGMAKRARLVDGKPTSLLDLGYSNVGLDDNWQKCGSGDGTSFHDAHGTFFVHEHNRYRIQRNLNWNKAQGPKPLPF